MIARPPITRDGAQHDARRELSKAIYHQQSDPWPVRAVRWIGHQLDTILNKALEHAPAGDVGALSLVVLFAVVVALIVWRVGVPQRVATIGAVMTGTTTLTAAEHRRRSETAAVTGDYATAVLERMRAITRELEERNILDTRPGRTATEVATDAGPRLTGGAGHLHDAARTFNDVVYGGAAADADRLEVLVTADSLVRSSSRTLVMAT
jgi:hypothetical protein